MHIEHLRRALRGSSPGASGVIGLDPFSRSLSRSNLGNFSVQYVSRKLTEAQHRPKTIQKHPESGLRPSRPCPTSQKQLNGSYKQPNNPSTAPATKNRQLPQRPAASTANFQQPTTTAPTTTTTTTNNRPNSPTTDKNPTPT